MVTLSVSRSILYRTSTNSSILLNHNHCNKNNNNNNQHTYYRQLSSTTTQNSNNNNTSTHCYIWGQSTNPVLPTLQKQLLRPTLVDSPKQNTTIKQIVFSTNHNVLLTNDGTVYINGDYINQPRGIKSWFSSSKKSSDSDKLHEIDNVHDVIQIAAGVNHTVLLDNNGSVYTSGAGGTYFNPSVLGLGHNNGVEKPTKVDTLKDEKVVHVSAGQYHTLALTDTGRVFAWGKNDHGRLGIGGVSSSLLPVRVDALLLERIIDVKCGSSFNIALAERGGVYTWGKNDKGQLGLGVSLILDQYSMEAVPNRVQFDEEDMRIISIDVGYRHCIVVDSQNRVWHWGRSQYLQPTLIKGDDSKFLKNKIVRVAAGKNFSAAVDEHGHLFTWGEGSSCCLGHGNKNNVNQPRLVDGFGPKGEYGRVLDVFASNTSIGVLTAK